MLITPFGCGAGVHVRMILGAFVKCVWVGTFGAICFWARHGGWAMAGLLEEPGESLVCEPPCLMLWLTTRLLLM